MTRYDSEIALVLWILSLAGAWWMPLPLLFTTFNLWHQRRTSFDAGKEFVARVRALLSDDLVLTEQRLTAVEKIAEDIKEAQIKIAGAFRGRSLPL